MSQPIEPVQPIESRRADRARAVLVRCALLREGVEEGARGAEVDAPEAAEHRVEGRAQHQEVERLAGVELAGERLGESAGAAHLGRQNLLRRLRRLEQHHAAARHPGGVDHTGDRLPEAGAGRGEHGAHRLDVADIGARRQHLAARLHDREQPADLAAGPVLLAMPREPAVPRLARREGRAAGQHQLRRRGSRQVLGERQPHAAQPAGDQHHAALAHTALSTGAGRERDRLEALHPAPAAAPGHDAVGGRRRRVEGRDQLAGEPVDLLSRAAAARLRQVEVDRAAGKVGDLLRHDLDRPQHERLLRFDALLAAHGLHPARDHLEAKRLRHPAPGEGARQAEQAVEAEVLDRHGRRPLPHAPQVGDAVEPPTCLAEVAQQRLVVAALSRAHGPRLLAEPHERRPGLDSRHPPSHLPQPRGELGAEAVAVEEQQPAAGRLLFLWQSRSRGERGHLAPGGDVEPLRDLRPLAQRGLARQLLERGAPRLDPVALALEGVGGQAQAPPALAGVEAPPVDRRAGQPELAQGLEQETDVGLLVLGMAQRIEHRLARRSAQDAAARGCESVWPGPTSRKMRSPSAASSPMPSANRTVPRRWRTQ